MKIRVHVSPNDAMAGGHDNCGSHIVPIAVAELSEKQRAELAHYQSDRESWVMFDYELPKRPPIHVAGPANAGVADVTAYLDRLADHRAAKLAHDKQANSAKIDTFVQAASTYLAETACLPADATDAQLNLAYTAPKLGADYCACEPDVQELYRTLQQRRDAFFTERTRRREAKRQADRVAWREAAVAWIGKHGSQRLRRLLSEGIEHDALLQAEQTEYARSQLPAGWSLLSDLPQAEQTAPENSEPEALLLLDLARVSMPSATLSRFVMTTTGGEEHVIEMPVAALNGRDLVFTFPRAFSTAEEDEDETVEIAAKDFKRAAAGCYQSLLQDINAMVADANAEGRQDRAATLAGLRQAVNAVAAQHGLEVTSIE
jgi:hypothetical protein